MKTRNPAASSTVLVLLGLGGLAHASAPLSLDGFLDDVRAKNSAYQGSAQNREGSIGRTREADLVTSPSLFATAQYEEDSKYPTLPIFSYDKLVTQNYTLGVSEQFDFGLQAKLYYAYDYTNYENVQVSPGTTIPSGILNPQDARPVLELTMPLWGGGFGRTVQANKEVKRYQATVDEFAAEDQLRSLLEQAEGAYWQLATSREIVTIEERAVNYAQATYNYNDRKAKMNLAESSDVLQSEAALENAMLSLKTARDNARSAERAFNLVRNSPLETTPEELSPIDWASIEGMPIPKTRNGNRADVEQAAAQTQVNQANSKIAIENDKPTLEAFGTYAMNGRSYTGFGDAFTNSFDSGRPTKIIGMRFTMPLNFAAQEAARKGAEEQENGANLRYRQTVADQEQQWNDLVSKLTDAQSQLHYARIIEGVQKKKLENEEAQLRRGRTTTFQVLQFEQDYTNSQLTRAQTGAQALSLRSQLKLYQSSASK